ncbi:S-layer homology domain-containing protein, partial [Paenibacillus sp. TAF58]
MKRKLGFVGLILWICLITAFSSGNVLAVGTPAYTLTSQTSQVTVGSNVTFTIKGTNVKDVFGYEVIVAYDTDRLTFQQASSQFQGAANGFTVPPVMIGNQVTFAFTKLGQGVGESGDLTFNTLTFMAKQAGSAHVSLLSVKTVNSNSENAIWESGSTASVTINESNENGNTSVESGSSQPQSSLQLDISKGAKVTQETSTDGLAVTKVSVDADKLKEALAATGLSDGSNQSVLLEVKSNDPIVRVDLPANILTDTAKNKPNTLVQIKLDYVTYYLPVILTKDLAGNGMLSVILTKVSGQTGQDVNMAVQRAGAQQVTSPIAFNLELNGKILTDFKGVYVDRTLKVNGTVDPSLVTAVWIDINNSLHFVPSVVSNNGATAEITIHSPHNSIYTVIQSNRPVFTDLQNHWAQADVELLANKLIVNGVGNNSFVPEQAVTRAEFAALLVRSLGLEITQENTYIDVKATDWFAGAVSAAQKAGLVNGYEDQSFRPGENITR